MPVQFLDEIGPLAIGRAVSLTGWAYWWVSVSVSSSRVGSWPAWWLASCVAS